MKAFSGNGLMDTGSLFFDPELSRLTTGRTTSLFAEKRTMPSSGRPSPAGASW
jgi:hypothetical protein